LPFSARSATYVKLLRNFVPLEHDNTTLMHRSVFTQDRR
jgi:hypothetical protein